MKRIFAAVDISEEARSRASLFSDNLRRRFPSLRVGWDRPEKLHLTLKFLGETNEIQLENFKSIAAGAARRISPFKLRLSGTGIFPNARSARVLWLGVIDEEGNLAKINRIFESECEKIGFEREKRSYRPHLTIARLKEPQNSRELIETHLDATFEPVEFDVAELVIYESELLPAGSIYRRIAGCDLNAA